MVGRGVDLHGLHLDELCNLLRLRLELEAKVEPLLPDGDELLLEGL